MLPDEFRDPKELKAGHLKWLGRNTFKGLGKLQATLNTAERKMLVDQLATSLDQYEKLALGLSNVREYLYKIYNETVISGMATSQFSNQFNMSVKGHNDDVRDKVDAAFKEAHLNEQAGGVKFAVACLRSVRLSHKVMFSDGVVELVKASSSAASQELVRITQYREKLFRSAVKLAVSVARKQNSQLDGNTVEWTDLVQEAVIGLMQAVDAYHPIDDGKTFTSYIHTSLNGVVSNKVKETTRTVAIPRTTLDRFVYVHKAIEEQGLTLSDLRGGIWQDGKLGDGKIDYNTLCEIADCATMLQKGNRPFSTSEVEELIMTTQDEISMDLEVEHVDGTEAVTFGETLPDDQPTVEERIDGTLVGRRLMALVRRYTTDEEYALMELRYGMGAPVRGYKLITEQYTSSTGKPMNKGKAAEIDRDVLERLRRAATLNPRLMSQFKEVMATVASIPES